MSSTHADTATRPVGGPPGAGRHRRGEGGRVGPAGDAPDRSVVAKVALILDTFVEGGQATLVDVVRSTGLPMSTAHRLVSELAARHLLRRDDHGVYRPGALLHLLAGHGPAADLVGPADAVLGDVARATGGTARLGVLDGSDVEIVAERRWRYPTARPGPPARLPAHATAAGKPCWPSRARRWWTACWPAASPG